MPRDNHPRERQARALARKKQKRPPFDRVLIVTEGSKTEPQYLEEIRKQKKVSSAHIEVIHADGTQPIQVLEHAHQRFLEHREFEHVYAVFDRDEHPTYREALERAERLDRTLRNDERQLVRFFAIPSVPSFELWLLLHYQWMGAFTHHREPAQRLRAHISGYEKGAAGMYALTEDLIDTANRHAADLRQQFSPSSGTQPYTDIDLLVDKLRSIRS